MRLSDPNVLCRTVEELDKELTRTPLRLLYNERQPLDKQHLVSILLWTQRFCFNFVLFFISSTFTTRFA